jgi:uncharacterized protein
VFWCFGSSEFRVEKSVDMNFDKSFRFLISLPGLLLIAIVRIYQWTLGPLLGRHCRFEPSCSRYFIEAVRKYGAVRGACRGVKRICRCHPWNAGGDGPP